MSSQDYYSDCLGTAEDLKNYALKKNQCVYFSVDK